MDGSPVRSRWKSAAHTPPASVIPPCRSPKPGPCTAGVSVPNGVSVRDATCAPVAFGTVQHMLFDNAKLEAGESILVQAFYERVRLVQTNVVMVTLGGRAKETTPSSVHAMHIERPSLVRGLFSGRLSRRHCGSNLIGD